MKKSFLRFLKAFDLFSVPVELHFNKKSNFKSFFGGLVSLIIMALSLYFLVQNLIAWLSIEISTTIYSSESDSFVSLLNQNRSIEYSFNNINYGIYFSVWAELPNSTVISYKNLATFFQVEYLYSFTSYESDLKHIDSKDCSYFEMNEFLQLPYNKANFPANSSNEWRMCVKNQLKMGLFADQVSNGVFNPTLNLQIRPCKNTSVSSKCASEEKINEIIKYTIIQASIPMTNYDFKNQSSIIRRTYKYEYYRIDRNLKKLINLAINPTFLYKDYGLFADDYKLDSINFNPGQQTIDFNSKKEEDDVLFSYSMYISTQNDKYYIRNQKLHEIIGSFGGFISVLLSIGSFICVHINKLLFFNSLMNFAFTFEKDNVVPSKENIQKQKINSAVTPTFKFTLTSYLFALFRIKSKEKDNRLYQKSRKLINQYIDIKKIMERLQDIDKLKQIIFTDSQKFFFDLIPKPKITGNSKNQMRSIFWDNKILKTKLKTLNNTKISQIHDIISRKKLNDVDFKIFSHLDAETLEKFDIESNIFIINIKISSFLLVNGRRSDEKKGVIENVEEGDKNSPKIQKSISNFIVIKN